MMPEKKRKVEKYEQAEDNEEARKQPKVIPHLKNQEQRLIVVLEGANLEVIKVGERFELLNCDDHLKQMKKHGKDPAHARPDITHQCLLMLFDSPLNRAGLLQMSVRAADSSVKLMKIIKNPVSDHLPIGCKKLTMSFHAEKTVHPRELVPASGEPVVLVIGAMAHGSVDVDYTEDTFSISDYPLSGALACSKICTAFEEKWGIL
ncbi:ribosomal RNA small subunit methyltransferase NEP1-like isoform X2 [Varroa jacobsoni]|uniref:Ribosomal RNA small subunit methyltransferase NEP1 n=1 Tax=Varroa destructor TaxID=109461 RepID=A0A7M7JMF5_VARDE|nr:ribosomal RNA small subunit methyltransferase NEP1-like isoform X2 [Varroa destructor]XP_022704754.1 ribosomal RNA small subunit methyltransferase NEP1-like isoform X2 [Varroa jacobsoni]